MNQSIHTIDLLYYLAGDVDWVCAFADRSIHKRIEVEDNAVAILKFKNGHQKNFEDVVRALKKGTPPLIDGPEGRKSVEIILAIYRSALTDGKPVQLPLKRTPPRKPFR